MEPGLQMGARAEKSWPVTPVKAAAWLNKSRTRFLLSWLLCRSGGRELWLVPPGAAYAEAKSLGGKPWAGWRQCRIPIASSRPGIFPFAFKAQLRLLSLWSHHKKPTDNTTKIIIPWKDVAGSTAHAASVRLPAYTRKRVLQPGFWIWCLWSRI